MTKRQIEKMRDNLLEVRAEISRINSAAGQTVFNPAATAALDDVVRNLDSKS